MVPGFGTYLSHPQPQGPPWLPLSLVLFSQHTSADQCPPHAQEQLTQRVVRRQHLKSDSLPLCGQLEGEPSVEPLDLHSGRQLHCELTVFQTLPDLTEDFILVFLLILELLKVTDKDDDGPIRAAPQHRFPAIGAALPVREMQM